MFHRMKAKRYLGKGIRITRGRGRDKGYEGEGGDKDYEGEGEG